LVKDLVSVEVKQKSKVWKTQQNQR